MWKLWRKRWQSITLLLSEINGIPRDHADKPSLSKLFCDTCDPSGDFRTNRRVSPLVKGVYMRNRSKSPTSARVLFQAKLQIANLKSKKLGVDWCNKMTQCKGQKALISSNSEGRQKAKKRERGVFSGFYFVFLLCFLFLAGCKPALYPHNIKGTLLARRSNGDVTDCLFI